MSRAAVSFKSSDNFTFWKKLCFIWRGVRKKTARNIEVKKKKKLCTMRDAEWIFVV